MNTVCLFVSHTLKLLLYRFAFMLFYDGNKPELNGILVSKLYKLEWKKNPKNCTPHNSGLPFLF